MDQDPQVAPLNPKQQVVERVRAATNVLVTVRSNPTVDELAAAIGLTLMLNKLGKHATAVFSGKVPSTLEFLKPEETIEQTTDSLRDFIVSLDKSKADKLRYKVEENVVKIFITPYRTSITQDDLEFTQGDFNVDVVLALGVTVQGELDQAITAHGRILHDATVISVIAGQQTSELGAINWQEPAASSLSEMLVSVSEAFQGGIIDEQMATAFLTGIVAETQRFSNNKTSPKVMTMAAQLMAAGANQQLIANELQKVEELPANQPVDVPHEAPQPVAATTDDGSLTIDHKDDAPTAPAVEAAATPPAELPEPQDQPSETITEAGAATPQAPEHQEPSLEVRDNLAASEESFVSPMLPSESGGSYEPLLPGSQATDGLIAPEKPVDIFAPQPAQDGQIHIDEHGNMVRKDAPLQPHHKVIEPLRPSAGPSEPSLDAELANISAMLKQPEIHGEIKDVKATDPGQAFPEQTTSVPELDLPTLPDPAPAVPVSTIATPSAEPKLASQVPPAAPTTPATPPVTSQTLPAVNAQESSVDKTLFELEMSVQSPHLGLSGDPEHDEAAMVNHARNAVDEAVSQTAYRPEARADLNAQPLGMPNQPPANMVDPSAPTEQPPQDPASPPPPVPPPFVP
jgi:hypothetical protein